jgi:DNA repair exonuclease SbcCD ATPase subunit
MPSAFELEVDKCVTATKTLTTEVAKLTAGVKTHASNYDNACNMCYASEDQIKELKEAEKEGEDTKAPIELKKWQTNHPKLVQRVKTEHAEVKKLEAGVAQAKKSYTTIKGTYDKLNKEAPKQAMADVKATAGELKGISTSLTAADKEIKRLDTVLENCVPYPKGL